MTFMTNYHNNKNTASRANSGSPGTHGAVKQAWYVKMYVSQVPADFENWHYVEMMGGTLRLKKGVLPHKYIDEPKGKPDEIQPRKGD
nr:unnamed protein product [Callosobruchus analis]